MKEIHELVDKIINCKNTLEKVDVYRKENVDCIIVVFDEPASKFDETFKDFTVENYSVFGLADYSKTWVLVPKDLALKVSKEVNFDLNILSYMKKKEMLQNDHALVSFLTDLKNKEFRNNVSTALFERFHKQINEQDLYEMIKCYVSFDNLDMKNFLSNDIVLNEDAFIQMKDIYDNAQSYNEYVKPKEYLVIVCQILKAVILKNTVPSKQERMDKFKKYCLEILYCYTELEWLLLIPYLNNEKNVEKLFQKLQISATKLEEDIYNTAWDIYHIRLMESRIKCKQEDGYFFLNLPYFATRDGGIRQIISFVKAKMVIFYNNQCVLIREKALEHVLDEFELPSMYADRDARAEKIKKVNFKLEEEKLLDELRQIILSKK